MHVIIFLFFIKFLADICIERIGILITKEEKDQEIPQLLLELTNGVVHIKQRTWDLILNSDLGELKMLDLTTVKPGTEREPLALLASEPDNKVFFLELCIAERQSPEYHTLFNSTHKTVRVTTFPMHFSLHKNSLLNVTTLLVSLLPSMEKTKTSQLATQTVASVDRLDEAAEGNLGYRPSFWGRDNEKGLNLKLTMHPASLTLYDSTGPFIRAEFLGIQSSITLERLKMDLDLVIQGYLISDLNPETNYPKLLYKVDPTMPFLQLKMNVFKEATLNDKYYDLDQKDLYIEVKLARIRLILLAPLIAKVVPFFTQLAQVDFTQNTLIDSAKDAAAVTAKETAAAAKSNSSSRIALNIIIEAPSILIPLDSLSKDVFIIDVGNFKALNSFHFASETYGSPEDPANNWKTRDGLPTVVDKMQVTFSDLQINRCQSYQPTDINTIDTNLKFPILQPVNFNLFLKRTLNDCLADIPQNSLSVNIDIISILIKPQDLVSFAYIMKSLGLVQASLEITNARQHVNSQRSNENVVKSPSKDEVVDKTNEASTNVFVANATLETVKITVYSEGDSFADIFLTHLSVDAEIRPPVSRIRAAIRDLGVRDLTPNSIYPEILSTHYTTLNLIVLEFESYQNATKGDHFFDPDKCDGKLNLTIGKIKLYLIYSFINHILHTLLQFKVGRKTVNAIKKQAKKQATNTATSTVEMMTQNETKRFIFAVKIEAPVIVIPVSSESNEGLVFDLGLVTVNNSFSLEKPTMSLKRDYSFPLDISKQKLIFDKLDVSFSSIQLYRQDSYAVGKSTISDPILKSFELDVSLIRTIPFSISDKPQILLCISLSPVFMEFHLDDYRTILSIIQSNIRSGKVLALPIDETDVDPFEESESELTLPTDKSKDIKLPNLALFIHLDEYTLSVIARDQEISKLLIKSLDIELKSTDILLAVTGELGEMKLTQPSQSETALYSNIIALASDSKQFIRFSLTFTPNLPHKPNLSSFNTEYDIDLNVEVGEVEIVLLYSYISKIINFATNFTPKRSPKLEEDTILRVEESIPPDERILGMIASLDKFALKKERAKVNINIKAPKIYIPQNSKSNQVIIARLGEISLKTEPTITVIPDTKEEILKDSYQLTLSKLTISRAFLHINENKKILSIISVRPLTSRFCLEISLVRRITLSANNPFLLVHLHLHEISLLLGSLDVDMIGNLITEQFKDHDTTLKYNDTDFSFSLPTSPKAKPEVEMRRKTRRFTRRDSILHPHAFQSDPNTSLLSMNIQIDTIGLKLFHWEKDIAGNLKKFDDELNVFPIPEEKSLAYLAVVCTTFNADFKPNLVTEMDLVLNDILVQDGRIENASNITRMISRSIFINDNRPLLAIHLKRISSDDLTVRVFLCNLTAIFSTEFLITLAQFFWDPIEKITRIKGDQEVNKKKKQRKAEVTRNKEPKDNLDQVPTFRINLAVKNPTVLLIENTGGSNPRTLVGKLEFSGIIKHDRGMGFSTTLTLSSGQLYTCQYQTINSPYSYVIAPFNLQLTMKGIAEDVHIVIESLVINLSPSTLALVTVIAESLKFPDKNELGYAPANLWSERQNEKYSWFLNSSESIDSWSVVVDSVDESTMSDMKTERLDFEVRSIDFKLDSEFKGKITPVILLHASAEASIQNWSTHVEMDALFTVEASYFNDKLSTWEPLLEPGKSRTTDNLVPLRLKAELNKSDKGSSSDVLLISDSSIQTQALQAEYALEVTAIDGVNLTISRELIEVLSKYKEEFDVVKSNIKSWDKPLSTDNPDNFVYLIQNELGIPINIALDEKDTLIFDPRVQSKAKTLEDNTPVYIYSTNALDDMAQSILSKRRKVKNHYIHLSIENFSTIPFIPIHRTGNLLYFLPPTTDHFVVLEINLIQSYKQIIIRAPMKIRNELEITMEIFRDSSELISMGAIKPGQTFYVPVHFAFHSKFHIAPYQLMYGPSNISFGNHSKFLTLSSECPIQMDSSSSGVEPPFSFTLEVAEDNYEREPLRFKQESEGDYPHHIFTAHVPSILHNLLPIPLNYEVEHSKFKSQVQPGTTSNILFYIPDSSADIILTISLFGTSFRGTFNHLSNNDTTSCKMHSSDGKVSFVLGIYSEITGSLQIKVFAAYWIINKTVLNLEYTSHESCFNDALSHVSTDPPLLFPSTILGSKVKLAIRCVMFEGRTSEWSNSVAIGAVGSENFVESKCPDTNNCYQFGIKITTSSLSLTKIVIIKPYNLLINHTKQKIQVQQNVFESIILQPGDCKPFYPSEDTCKIIPDTSTEGAILDHIIPGQILLSFDGENPAIAVDISTNVSSNVITFQSFYNGAVPLEIVNSSSEVFLEFRQKGCIGKSIFVPPGLFMSVGFVVSLDKIYCSAIHSSHLIFSSY